MNSAFTNAKKLTRKAFVTKTPHCQHRTRSTQNPQNKRAIIRSEKSDLKRTGHSLFSYSGWVLSPVHSNEELEVDIESQRCLLLFYSDFMDTVIFLSHTKKVK